MEKETITEKETADNKANQIIIKQNYVVGILSLKDSQPSAPRNPLDHCPLAPLPFCWLQPPVFQEEIFP